MDNVKVSVIVPVYNVLEYLRTCLDSLAAQTMRECEFIIVSDGASEEECGICEGYASRDSRFRFFRRNHFGVAATRNYGVAQARGKYISFVDGDDWLRLDVFKDAYSLSVKTNSDVTFWNYVISTPKGMTPQIFSSMNDDVVSEEMLTSIRKNIIFVEKKNFLMIVCPWCKLYKTSLVKKIPFDENLHMGSDHVFNFEVFSKEIRVAYLNRSAYCYRQNNDSITRRYRHNAFEVLMKSISRLDELSNGSYHAEICVVALYKFIDCLSLDYFHKDNPFPLKENIKRLKRVFYSESFRHIVENCPICRLKISHKIDYFFIKFKVFPWLYIRTVLLFVKRNLV